MRIRFLPEANADLTKIGDYYLDIGGKALALRMVRGIRQEVAKSLRDNPLIAPSYEIVPGLRRLVVTRGAFLVFYSVTDQVEVLHVRRAERAPVTERELDADNDPPGAATPGITEEEKAKIRKSMNDWLKTGLQ